MSEEPDWARVLETIYSEDLIWPIEEDIDSDHTVVSNIELEEETIHNSLAFLSQAGLIGRIHAGMKADVSRPGKESLVGITNVAEAQGSFIGLTERGFLVAHQRQMEKNQQKQEDRRAERQDTINYLIGILTFGLLTVTVLDSAISIFIDTGSYINAYLTIGSGIILVLSLSILFMYVKPFS